MHKNIKKDSETLSSNWFKKLRVPYLTLLFDIIVIILSTLFTIKEYLIGGFLNVSPHHELLLLIILSMLLFFRFNISLLIFARQRIGLYLSTIFLMCIILVELVFTNYLSPFLFVFNSIVIAFNKYFFTLPDFLNETIKYFLYFFSFYYPLLYYVYLVLFKRKICDNAIKFDVLTGFYATVLSTKLKIMDVIIIAFYILIAMCVGLISDNINWSFLSVLISTYAVRDMFVRFNLKNKISKVNKYILYVLTALISFGIIYTQRFPYYGLIFFIASNCFIFIYLMIISKNLLKSSLIAIICFIIIPLYSLGYNIFSYPQCGVISKSIPFDGEKLFFVVKDKDGDLGIRRRSGELVEPKYIKVEYNKKNEILLLNKENKWELYNLAKMEYIL